MAKKKKKNFNLLLSSKRILYRKLDGIGICDNSENG